MIKTIVVKATTQNVMQEELDEALNAIGKGKFIDIKLAGGGNADKEHFMAILIYEERLF